MKGAIVILFFMVATFSLSAAFGDGCMTSSITVSGHGQTKIVNTAFSRETGISHSEVIYGEGSIDYTAVGRINGSDGVFQTVDRMIELPKGLLVNVQHMESSPVFSGKNIDISNINIATTYKGRDNFSISPNSTSFNVTSEFKGRWNLDATRFGFNRNLKTGMMLNGKFEVGKELFFK